MKCFFFFRRRCVCEYVACEVAEEICAGMNAECGLSASWILWVREVVVKFVWYFFFG